MKWILARNEDEYAARARRITVARQQQRHKTRDRQELKQQVAALGAKGASDARAKVALGPARFGPWLDGGRCRGVGDAPRPKGAPTMNEPPMMPPDAGGTPSDASAAFGAALAALVEDQADQLRADLADAGLEGEMAPSLLAFHRTATATRHAIAQARSKGPLATERDNPPGDVDWLTGAKAMLADTRVRLVQTAFERAATEARRAEQRVQAWRALRAGRRATPTTRYEVEHPFLINGSEWS